MKVLTETWWSASIGREKSVNVVLPARYSSVGRAFPVLYLLHGFGGNRTTWLQCEDLSTVVDAAGLIVVLPESGRSWFINDARGRRYEDYLVREVIGHVDGGFNTVASRDGRGVGGFSMGGAAALYQALRHGDLFSVVCSNAGAFEAPLRDGDPYHRLRDGRRLAIPTTRDHERVWGPVGSEVRREYDPYRALRDRNEKYPIEVHLDVGLDDYPRMIGMNRRMRDALSERSVPHRYRERPGGHDWTFVNAGLPDLFAFARSRLLSA
ncbi:alpha/beta hydrolase [Actinomadura algeriensis]|uniref:S-formylglutathione hydrolase n=1 Tax=Actinomadura algeriensis TaxID=1679523 RepID=A0ABR9K1R2_9ACTN|nr:alpha/beta fold hydrolase [Actinomadura algeriensis]MBE1536762.1 S-formylglutathione hydrolase [Actinomadura algeriensis]